jgi:O-antigen/teichoic acid export membrane protein
MIEPTEAKPAAPLHEAPAIGRNIAFVAKGGGVTFAGKMFLTGIRVVTAVILARLLQADQLGMYSLALSAANIAVAIAILGLDAALVRYVAVLTKRKDEEELWGALQIGIGVSMLFSVLTGTLLFALAYPAAEILFNYPDLAPLLQLVSVLVPVLTLSEVLAGACRGFKRMDYAALAQFVVQPIIRLALIIILAVGSLTISEAIITFGLADLAASILFIFFLNKQFGLRRPLRAARRDTRAILEFSIPVWLSDMMVKFHGNFQTILLGSLSTFTGVGIFTVASQVTTISSQFSSSINVSAKPVIAELHEQNDLPEMGRIYQATNKWGVMVQLPIFLLTVLYAEQILSIFGQSFTNGATALIILALSTLIIVGTGMGGIIIDMTGHTKLKLFNSIVRVIIFLCLDILLIPRWGVVGAATAALIGEAIVNLLRIAQVYILFRLMPYNRDFLKPLAAALPALFTALAVGRWLPPQESLVYAAIGASAFLLVYAALILLFGFSSEERAMTAAAKHRAQHVLARAKVW